MHAAGLTHKGQVREQNQDTIFVTNTAFGPLPNLFIVADGMGGHNAGEVASLQAVTLMTEYIRTYTPSEFITPDNYLDLLVTAVQDVNTKLANMAKNDKKLSGMGTTLTACVITDEKMIFVHIGDSRAYAIAKDAITKLTSDHSWVEQMVQSGQMTAEEALTHPKRNVITKVLGTQGPLEVDGLVLPIGETITVLLCSDGLSNMLDDNKMKNIINGVGFAEHRVQFLIEDANSQGGHDNISAILIDIKRNAA